MSHRKTLHFPKLQQPSVPQQTHRTRPKVPTQTSFPALSPHEGIGADFAPTGENGGKIGINNHPPSDSHPERSSTCFPDGGNSQPIRRQSSIKELTNQETELNTSVTELNSVNKIEIWDTELNSVYKIDFCVHRVEFCDIVVLVDTWRPVRMGYIWRSDK